MLLNKPSLSQIAFIKNILSNNEHFDIFDLTDAYKILGRISPSQYKYLVMLIAQRNYLKAKQLLSQFGFNWKRRDTGEVAE